MTDYKFKYGRNPLLELPLAINPSGAARTEPRLRNLLHWKRPHTQRTGSSARPVFASSVTGMAGEAACPYSKQFVHSKSSQYKKMKQEWRNNVYLARYGYYLFLMKIKFYIRIRNFVQWGIYEHDGIVMLSRKKKVMLRLPDSILATIPV